jgi:hypothetical protein
MKRLGLIGLSVAAAAMIMTGCGGGGGSSSSGLSTPAELKTPTEMNLTQVQKVMGAIGVMIEGGGVGVAATAAPKVAATLDQIETKAESSIGIKALPEPETIDCPVSGTYTISFSASGNSETLTCQMNNCVSDYMYVDDTYGACDIPIYAFQYIEGDAIGVHSYTFNGRVSVTVDSQTYNSDTNQSAEGLTVDVVDYKAIHENNETDAGEMITADFTHSWGTSNDGDYIYVIPFSAEQPAYNVMTDFNGMIKYINIDDTGAVGYGYLLEGNVNMDQDGVQDENIWKITANGFISYYSISGSENNTTLIDGLYANNLAVAYNGFYAPEENITIDGELGSACLGGSVMITTDPVVQANTVDYDNNESDGTLPYAGKVALKGTTDAAVTFDHNATHSYATVSTTEGNTTYGAWSTLAELCELPYVPWFPEYIWY